MANLKISELTNAASLTGSEVVPIVQGTSTVKTTVQDIANLAGLGGTNYVFAAANGTDLQNAIELQTAYNTAKTMAPAVDNRITVIAAPGDYKFASPLVLDTQFIDLVSLTGNADVVFDVVGDPVNLTGFNITNIVYPLAIVADNVYVKGIYGKEVNSPNFTEYWGGVILFKIGIDVATNLPNITVENCDAGFFSFGSDYTFTNNPTLVKNISGNYINCRARAFSFASWGTASGRFINCHILTSTSNDGFDGFGNYGTASGYFENCSCEDGYLASGSISSGIFNNCNGGRQAFGATASGTFTSCTGGLSSFGSTSLTGKLYYCRKTSEAFQTVSGGGITRYCIDGNNVANNQG